MTSHHVVEEVLFVFSKIEPKTDLAKVVNRIKEIPGIILAEPSPNLAFAGRYAALSNKLKMGVNDALLLQLILDAGITKLFSYDKQFIGKATQLGVRVVT